MKQTATCRRKQPGCCERPGCEWMRPKKLLFADVVLAPPDADGDGGARRQVLDEAAQVIAARVVLQFAERLRFDLADAFAGDLEDSSGFFERVAVAVAEAVPQL